MKTLYLDTIFSGLIPVKPLYREVNQFDTHYVVVKVTQSRPAYPKDLKQWIRDNGLVVKTRRIGIHQYVRNATHEEIDAHMKDPAPQYRRMEIMS